MPPESRVHGLDGGYSVHPDLKRNILHIQLGGRLTDEQIEACCDDVDAAAARMRPGFAIITDLRNLQWLSSRARSCIIASQRYVQSLAPRQVIRVVGRNTEGVQQFGDTLHENGYLAAVVSTLDEAELLISVDRQWMQAPAG